MAEGTDIYQAGHVDRQVYEIRAVVQAGDSGGKAAASATAPVSTQGCL